MSRARVNALNRAKNVLATARDEGRNLTPSEQELIEAMASMAESDGADEYFKQFGGGAQSVNQVSADWTGDPGSTFIRSEGYKRIKDSTSRGQRWSTGVVEISSAPMEMKGTLLAGAGAPGSGTGGGLVPVPQVVPGVVGKLFQPLTLEALLSAGQATTSTVRYAVEGTATSAAAGVPEGGVKPESTLAFSTVDERVKKVASTISISDELLSDAPAIQSFINGELGRFINIEVERQLLRGAAGGDEVQGLLTSRGVPVYTASGTDNIAVQLFKGANTMRGSAFIEPEWYVVSPGDYEKLRLLRDGTGGTAGQFMGGGPFLGAYGVGQGGAASPQITGVPDLVWGKPTYVSPIIGSGTALVGTRAGAQVWSRGGLTVEASSSHESYFVKDLVAIRAERRLALTLYRSNAYVEIRGLA
jgi:HK97 family phage major capsid protein